MPVPYTRDDAAAACGTPCPVVGRPTGSGASRWSTTGRPFAGTVSLRNRDEGRAEVAYGSHPDARGRGVMSRALRLLLAWGFSPPPTVAVTCGTVVWLANRGNWASRRLAWERGLLLRRHAPRWLAEPPWRDGRRLGGHAASRRGDGHRGTHVAAAHPRIVGEPVVLRATAEADIPRIVEGVNDPQRAERYSRSLRERAPHDEATGARAQSSATSRRARVASR